MIIRHFTGLQIDSVEVEYNISFQGLLQLNLIYNKDIWPAIFPENN